MQSDTGMYDTGLLPGALIAISQKCAQEITPSIEYTVDIHILAKNPVENHVVSDG